MIDKYTAHDATRTAIREAYNAFNEDAKVAEGDGDEDDEDAGQ